MIKCVDYNYYYVNFSSEHCKTKESSKLLCCVCQEESVNPVELPCSHVFCYLCVKGVAARSGSCALCRQRIPIGYLEKPTVLNTESLRLKIHPTTSEKYHWFYEGKNGGWWMYEDRTSEEIERGYRESNKTVMVQISGFSYIVDYESMVQFRENHPNRKRKIKRDVVSSDGVKGVAGIYIGGSQVVTGVNEKTDKN